MDASTVRKASLGAILASALAGALVPGPVAGAQDVRASAARAGWSGITLEEVVVVAKRRMPLQAAPASVTLLDHEHIVRTLSQDIRELVRYEPGISVRNDPIRFGTDSFAIRGIGGDRIVAEVDGIGAAESFSVGALADSGRSYTDLEFIRRVEILRGPASALYGSDAIGGVVHVETIDPVDLLGEGRNHAGRMRAGYRNDNDGWFASALNAWRGEAAQLLLGYVHRERGAAEIAGGLKPNPRDSVSDQVLAKLALPDVAGGPLEATLEAGRLRDSTRVDALLGTPPRFVNTIAMQGEDTAERVRLSIEQSLSPHHSWADEVRWQLYAQRTDTEQITHERRRAAPPRAPALELRRLFALEDEQLGAELTASKGLAAGAWSHQIVYGVELEHGRITEERDGHQQDLSSGELSNVILGEVFPLRDFPVTERFEAGFYLQDEVQLPNRRWRLTPGVRFELYRLRPREDAMYREDNPSARPVSLDEHSLAPKLALSYALGEHASAYAQYARGFRSPPFEDVNIGLEIPLFNYRALPNPQLRPERSDTLELGLRARGHAWHTHLSSYYTKFEDFIESRVNLGPDPVTGMTLFQSRNLERAYMYGIELSTQLDAGALTPGLQGWTLALKAAWARGEDRVNDEPLSSIEPLKANLMIEYEAPAGWGLRTVFTGVAAQDRLPVRPEPLFRTGGYFVLDAYGYFTLGERGQVNLGFTNLTDQEYIDWIDVRGRSASDPLVPYAVHPGRSASITMSWEF